MMKGALVELVPIQGAAAPNVIVFQFNPETLRHSFSQTMASPPEQGHLGSNALAVPGPPTETFSFTLSMDAADDIADPVLNRLGPNVPAALGLYPRLSALEMLIYPTTVNELLADDSGSDAAEEGVKRPTPSAQLPVVLFVWGPGRILPVRVTSLSIMERLYDGDSLSPTQAEAEIELRVLTSDDLKDMTGPGAGAARAVYKYSLALRMAGAARAMSGPVALAPDLIRLVTTGIKRRGCHVLPR